MNGELSVAAAFAAGIASSAHCLGMCGGVAGALGMRARVQGRAAPVACAHSATYHLGRLSSYAMAGAVCGAFGGITQALLDWVGLALWLRAMAGMLLMALGLQVAFNWRVLHGIERCGARIWRRMAPLAAHAPQHPYAQAVFVGALWGWLPCGLVYSMLLLGTLGGSAVHGASIMLAFGAGTLPAMLSASVLSAQVTRLAWSPRIQKNLKWLAGGLMLVFGAWTMWVSVAHLASVSHRH